MYKYLLITILFFTVFMANAQNRTTIKGKVTDSVSKAPIEFATVAILHAKDTTAAALITYAQTKADGLFTLQNLPAGVPLKVVVTFAANKPYIKFFHLIKGQTLDMATVALGTRQLNEVVIRGERMPITVNKDTIEFDATAFKVRPNAVVEDLLKKLPGVEVENNGKITVMGKQVGKVLVDGREFFPSDLRIATKNLDADMIAKVQVYDDRENDPDHIIPDDQVGKIINLKFKKALKKSIFGKVYGGEGTRGHYQAGGLLNMFRDTLQVSLLGLANNLNNTGFDFNDLYTNGGLNRGGGGVFNGVTNFGALSGFGGLAATGRETMQSGGINVNTDYGKKFQFNIAYLLKHTQTDDNSQSSRQQFLGDTVTTSGNTSSGTDYSYAHNVSSTLTWRPDGATQLTYTPGLTINNSNGNSFGNGSSYTNFLNPISVSTSNGSSSNNSLSFQQSLGYNKQLKKKGASFNVNHNLSYSPGTGTRFDNQVFTSYGITPSYAYRQEGQSVNRNFSVSTNEGYRIPISKKLTADVTLNEGYNSSVDKVSTYDYNPVTGQYDSFLLMKSSDLVRSSFTESVNAGLTLNYPGGLNVQAHINPQLKEVTNMFNRGINDISRNYFNLLPSAGINYKGYSMGYNRSVTLPNVGDMIPYTVVFSPLYSVTGNPNLKPTLRDNFTLGYHKYDFRKGTNINLGAGFNYEQNTIFRRMTQNSQLVQTSSPINRDGRYNFNFYGLYGKQIKTKKDVHLNLNTNFNVSSYHNFYVLNNQEGFQNNYTVSLSESLSFNYKDIIQLDPQYRLSDTYTTYSGLVNNNQTNLSHNLTTRYSFFLPKKFNIDGDYTYNYYPQVTPGFQKSSNLLNVAIAHQFMKKDHAEIKITCYDILDQSISNRRFVSFNSINDSQSEVVRRYFMVTLLFKFNKSTVKDDPKKPAIGPMIGMPMMIRRN